MKVRKLNILALFLLVAGLTADPLFCCALSSAEAATRIAAPMDCCEETGGGCEPRLEKPAGTFVAASLLAPPVPAADAEPIISVPAPSDHSVRDSASRLERPPRLHLRHAQLLI